MIYVHNKVGNVQFNTCIYVFLRSWFTHEGKEDTWYKVPAFRQPESNNVVCIIPALFDNSLVAIESESKRVIKAHNNRDLQTVLSLEVLYGIDKIAVDVPAWEKTNQSSYNYSDMIDPVKVRQRYTYKYGNANANYDPVTDQSYREVRRSVSPPVGCCGKRT